MARALSISNAYKKKFVTFDFDGPWLSTMGNPEKSGNWIVYGKEKNGKTWFSLKLADYLSQFDRVAYISGEEGTGMNFIEAMQRADISPDNKNLKIYEYLPLDELKDLLKKRRAPQVVILDNTTIYAEELAYGGFKKLWQQFPDTLFIYVAHEDRGEPYGATSKMIKKMSSIIVRVEGLSCFVYGRCPGGELTINYEQSELYHGTNNTDHDNQ